MKFFNFYSLSVTLIYVFILSCTVPIQRVEQAPERVTEKPVEINIRKIALIPFVSEEEVASRKEGFLTSALHNELISRIKKVGIVSLDSSIAEFTKVKEENPGLIYKDVALKVGNNLGAEAVLIGNIFTYKEREGTELGVTSPASVAFDVQLLNTQNGEIIWEGYFAETQAPLLENVAQIGRFIKRKGRWITADELAKEGVVEVVDRLNESLSNNSATN